MPDARVIHKYYVEMHVWRSPVAKATEESNGNGNGSNGGDSPDKNGSNGSNGGDSPDKNGSNGSNGHDAVTNGENGNFENGNGSESNGSHSTSDEESELILNGNYHYDMAAARAKGE